MKTIKLTQGKIALVDDAVYEWATKCKWYVIKSGQTYYVARKVKNLEGRWVNQLMHHLVVGITRLPKILKLDTDHRDGNGLNNQRNNLRIVTKRENSQNKIFHRMGKYPGIYRVKRNLLKPWRVQVSLGYFATEKEARKAYKEAVNKIMVPTSEVGEKR